MTLRKVFASCSINPSIVSTTDMEARTVFSCLCSFSRFPDQIRISHCHCHYPCLSVTCILAFCENEHVVLHGQEPQGRCSRTVTVTGREKGNILDRLNRLSASHYLASTRRKHPEIREARVVDLCHTSTVISITWCRKSLTQTLFRTRNC